MSNGEERPGGQGISQRAYLCLRSLYDQTGDSIMKMVPSSEVRVGPDGPAAGESVLDYLEGKGLLSFPAGRAVRITHRGIVEAERIIMDPALSDKYFGGASPREVKLVRERQERRQRLLGKLYDKLSELHGGAMDALIQHAKVTEGESLTDEEWEAVCDYLKAEGLVDLRVNGLIGITQPGIDAVEQFAAGEQTVNATNVPTEIRESLESFGREHPDPSKAAFIMMRFSQTKSHEAITSAIRNTLAPLGIAALRADDKEYHHDLFYNVLTYLHGCGFGIAVFERFETEDFNPNVALEVGYMLALGKPVCFLKDRTLKALHTDLVGRLYRPFDPQEIGGTIPRELARWLFDRGFVK